MTAKNILVLGASGYIGRNLIKRLCQQGHQVTAASRDVEQLSELLGHEVNCQYVDLFKPATIPPLLPKIEILYYLVHSMAEEKDLLTCEQQIANNLCQALKNSGVKHIIFLGAIQSETSHSKHMQARKITSDILHSGSIPVTELRAGIIIGPGSAAVEIMRDMVYNLAILTPPVWVRSKSSPIALDNLLFYLTEIIDSPAEHHRIFQVAGPQYISYQALFEYFITISGKKRWLVPIPLPTKCISVYWLTLITSVPRRIAKALIDGLEQSLPVDATPIQQLIPQPLLDYQQALRLTIAHETEAINSADWGYDSDALSRWRSKYGFYPKQAGAIQSTNASPQALWQAIQKIGGSEGYFYANSLWQLRARIDDVIGGMKSYGRPERAMLQVGDYVDSWKVIVCQPERKLTLLFGMKAPGLGRLTFTIKRVKGQQQIDVRAWWHPAGFSGLLYWFAMMPAHLFIFRGMAKKISRLAVTYDK